MRLRSWMQQFLAAGVLIATTLAVSIPAAAGAAAGAAPSIRPGSAVTFGGITCTAGALLHQGKTVFVAVPASCGGLDPGSYQQGCGGSQAPQGTPAKIAGARYRGILVYSSFTRMTYLATARRHTVASRRTCHYNDLALIKVDPRDRSRVSGAIPGTKAPTSVRTRSPRSGQHMTLGRDAATAGTSHQGGWVVDVSTSSTLSTTDVGAAAVAGGKLLGMLTVLPKGPVSSLPITTAGGSPPEVYSLHKALNFLRKTPGFHHVTLVAAGDHVS